MLTDRLFLLPLEIHERHALSSITRNFRRLIVVNFDILAKKEGSACRYSYNRS